MPSREEAPTGAAHPGSPQGLSWPYEKWAPPSLTGPAPLPSRGPLPGSSALGKLVRDRNSAGSVPRGDSPPCHPPPHSLPGPVLGFWGHRNWGDPAAPERPRGGRDTENIRRAGWGLSPQTPRWAAMVIWQPRSSGSHGHQAAWAPGSPGRAPSPGKGQAGPPLLVEFGALAVGRGIRTGRGVCRPSRSCRSLGFVVGRRPSPAPG